MIDRNSSRKLVLIIEWKIMCLTADVLVYILYPGLLWSCDWMLRLCFPMIPIKQILKPEFQFLNLAGYKGLAG
jgi:hypothetical protein